MDWSQHYYASLLGMLCTMIIGTSGHGRFIDPPSRVSAWNYGCSTCAQASDYIALYTDTQWNCGGMGHQWDTQNGACAVCGDPADGPYDSEAGGPYATGTIVRTYTKGSTIEVKVEITASHLGYIEFKLCPVNNMYVRATQECLDQYPVPRADGEGYRYYIPQIQKVYTVEVVLPPDLTCTQCVMQWHYWTENRWGDCGDGTGALGCGPQEVFRACSDVSISDDGDPVTNPPGTPPPNTNAPVTTKAPTNKPPTTKTPTTKAPTTKAPTTKPVTTLPPTTTAPPLKCVAKGKCKKKKGECIASSKPCAGKVIKKGCKTSGCQCCVPPIPCKQTSKCEKKGGSCIAGGLKCNGKVFKKKCAKRTKCQCCKAAPTTLATTPVPTTVAPTPAPTIAPTPVPTPAPTNAPATTEPSVLGCSIFKKSHGWKDNIQGDLTLTFPTTTSSWYLELAFSDPVSNFQVYIMQKDTSAGSSFTLTPFNWNSKQEAGQDLLVFIWITYSGFTVPQITSAKLSRHELC